MLTDSDPELARIGFLSAKLGMLPSELVKNSTKTELAFLDYWIKKSESEASEKIWYVLNRALGTLWERSDFAPKERTYKAKVLDRVWYPLSTLLAQTDLKKIIQKDFIQHGQQIGAGEYSPTENEEVVNLAQVTTKDQFLDFMRKFSGQSIPVQPSDNVKK